jgi:hypothetical protein
MEGTAIAGWIVFNGIMPPWREPIHKSPRRKEKPTASWLTRLAARFWRGVTRNLAEIPPTRKTHRL